VATPAAAAAGLRVQRSSNDLPGARRPLGGAHWHRAHHFPRYRANGGQRPCNATMLGVRRGVGPAMRHGGRWYAHGFPHLPHRVGNTRLRKQHGGGSPPSYPKHPNFPQICPK
jgi:hypothetical protein